MVPVVQSEKAARARVLVAEDSDNIRESLVELFGDEATVVAAATLRDALSALREHAFDLVIADLRLGNKADAGLQIMATASLLSPDAPVVALTAYASTAARAASKRLGAAHFLPKPADLVHIALLAAEVGVSSTLAHAAREF